jgi:hypothetical protein
MGSPSGKDFREQPRCSDNQGLAGSLGELCGDFEDRSGRSRCHRNRGRLRRCPQRPRVAQFIALDGEVGE